MEEPIQVIDGDYDDTTFAEIRDGCMNDLNADQCAIICAAPENEIISEDVRSLACVWQEAKDLDESNIFNTRCRAWDELEWCQYVCIDAANGNTWYWDSEVEEACAAVAAADRKRMMNQKMIDMRAHEAKMAAKRSSAGVSLASKGVEVES